MSEIVPPSALPASRPACSPAAGSRPHGLDREVPVAGRPVGLNAPARESPRERLVGLGVAEPVARALSAEHGRARVVDALDTLGEGAVRRRAGWVVSAIRHGWDLEGLLAERRQVEARYARWERERAERDRTAARWQAQQSTVNGWRAIVSAASDDRQLAVAVDR